MNLHVYLTINFESSNEKDLEIEDGLHCLHGCTALAWQGKNVWRKLYRERERAVNFPILYILMWKYLQLSLEAHTCCESKWCGASTNTSITPPHKLKNTILQHCPRPLQIHFLNSLPFGGQSKCWMVSAHTHLFYI